MHSVKAPRTESSLEALLRLTARLGKRWCMVGVSTLHFALAPPMLRESPNARAKERRGASFLGSKGTGLCSLAFSCQSSLT